MFEVGEIVYWGAVNLSPDRPAIVRGLTAIEEAIYYALQDGDIFLVRREDQLSATPVTQN